MSAPRLVAVLALILSACASWENSPQSAPPPPVEPGVPPPAEHPAQIRVAIASVQLLDDCPDPPAAQVAAPAAASRAAAGESMQKRSSDYVEQCAQSTVQLAVHSDRPGMLRIEALRVLDPRTQKRVGTTTLRQPTQWSTGGSYVPWNERVTADRDLQISYKLGALDLAQASELAGPTFNPYMGPFVLELDVSIDGVRQTIRSPEFGRQPPEIMVT